MNHEAPRSEDRGVDSARTDQVDGRDSTRAFRVTILAIGALGLAVRSYYVATVASKLSLAGDSYFFYYWPGVQLARGHGYLDYQSLLYGYPIPGAEHPPGFVAIIAVLYKLGFHSATDVRYAMSLLGSITIVIVGFLVAKLVSRRAGVIAALLTALYPNVWINDTLLMSETLMMFGIALALLGIYAFYQRPNWQNIVLASAGLTVAASARPENLVHFAVIILPLIMARRVLDVRKRIQLVALSAVLPLLAFVPWTVYNNARFSRAVTLSTGFGQTVQVGTCDTTFSGTYIGIWSLSCARTYATGLGSPTAPAVTGAQLRAYSDNVKYEIEYAKARGDLPPARLDKPRPESGHYKDQSVDNSIFLRQSLRYLWDHKKAFPKVLVAREARTLEVWNPHQNNALNVVTQRGSIGLVTFSQRMFWVMCLLSIAGARIFRKKKIPLYPLTAQMLLVAFVVGIAFGGTRYRAPVELCLVILAATSLDWFVGWVGRKGGGALESGVSADVEAPSNRPAGGVTAQNGPSKVQEMESL